MKVKEENEGVGLKINIQKTKIMASGPITSWERDGETVEIVSDFIFWGSKITADGDCSHEIKRCLLLGRKVMSNLESIFKSRDITLPTKICLVKAMVFPVVMYGCESWTVKKAECSVQFSHSVVSDSLRSHETQNARPPCPSPTPRVHFNLCPSLTSDAIQPSHPLSSPSPPAPNPSQHQGLFQYVNSSHEVAKVLEFQSQPQSFQWTPRTDLL